jgi:hypothetical protein
MSGTEPIETGTIRVRPVTRYGPFDSPPLDVRLLRDHTPRSLERAAGVRPEIARRVSALARRRPVRSAVELLAADLAARDVERLLRGALLEDDPRVVITDVQPEHGPIMSDRPFALRVTYVAARPISGIVRVVTEWAGEPFVVEEPLAAQEGAAGEVVVPFDKEQTLPVGPAVFTVSLITQDGATATFRVTCAVLPSNPLSLSVSPRDNFVTGSWSARAVRVGDAFATDVGVTLSNGDSAAVTMDPGFDWEFWDGPVGSGTLIEHGGGGFGGTISVPPFGTWGGWIVFTSPRGSGVFGRLDSKEDLALRITMRRSSGGAAVSGEITVRTMFRFGLNITRVGAESFTSQEYTDLYDAVAVTRSIYERRDVTLSVDRRNITNAQAGGFTVITSEDEARDLFEQWSGPDNDFIDVFVIPSIAGTGFDGLAGGIPGPTSHSGRASGVVAAKSGFVDGAGTRRLNVPYLGMLIGHEVGHYLGLSHVPDAGNLMLSNSSATDTALNYDPQYRTIIRHGWVRID